MGGGPLYCVLMRFSQTARSERMLLVRSATGHADIKLITKARSLLVMTFCRNPQRDLSSGKRAPAFAAVISSPGFF
jgi:hypothetical protein